MVGFEYLNRNDKTPFETFLQYTDEKQKSATKLAAILKEKLHPNASLLDIGTGNGEYLDIALPHSDLPSGVKLTLVEPSTDLASHLAKRFSARLPATSVEIIAADLQAFNSQEKFDIILMSHLFYHVPRAEWTPQLKKALSLLKPTGSLIIVLREKDDTYNFKMAFKPQLFGESFKALTIDDVLNALPPKANLRLTRQTALSKLQIPLQEKFEDARSIIEFFLNKEWHEIPPHIQQAAVEFMKAKQGIFNQIDGIALIEKPLTGTSHANSL